MPGPGGVTEQPFADGVPIADVSHAQPQLPFRAAVSLSVGQPDAVYVHETFRPQALGLVYQSAKLGRFTVTQERVVMSHDEQVAGLEQLAANCHPDTGCQGSWTIANLGGGTKALVISNPPDGVNAVIWIHGTTEMRASGW